MTIFTGPARAPMLVFAVLIALAATARQTPAASTFDGQWSVIIITEAGTCDRAYRYPVKVTNGELKYEGEAAVAITGHVDASGKINATIRRGEQNASGSGRLSSASGAGPWTGTSLHHVLRRPLGS